MGTLTWPTRSLSFLELAAGSFGSEIDRLYFECILKTVDGQINCFVTCSIERPLAMPAHVSSVEGKHVQSNVGY